MSMIPHMPFLLLSVVLSSCLCHAASTNEQPYYVEGEVLVRMKQDSPVKPEQGQSFKNCTVRKKFKYLSKRTDHTILHLQDKSRSTVEIIAALESDPDIELVCPNYYKQINLSAPPNDPDYEVQWALHNTGQLANGVSGTADADMDWPESRRLSADFPAEVVIAIIDTGTDTGHPDLINRLWINPWEIPDNGIDDDGNGYIDDINGYDFAGDDYTNANDAPANDGPDSNAADIGYHGTHVAGIAAAEANNGIGTAGVSRAKIMVLKASADGSALPDSATIAALEYATEMANRGVNLVAVNASYGGSGFSSLESAAIQQLGEAGVIFCTSAGNDATNSDTTPHYPSSYTGPDNIISVASTTSSDTLSDFSNYGASSVDIAAPGSSIYSTYPSYLSPDTSVQQGTTTYASDGFSFTGKCEGLTRPYYDCGIGRIGDFPPAVAGNIALIQRGTLYFFEKVQNAMDAGAVGVIIYNNTSSPVLINGTLSTPKNWIPAVSISKSNGEALLASVGSEITMSVRTASNSYRYLSGTSMAAPMVTGAIAVLAEHYPDDSVAERIQRLYDASEALPALSGLVATGARLNLATALDTDSDAIPDWFETTLGTLESIDASTDSDGDNHTDLWEFRAGTDPSDPNSYLKICGQSYDPATGYVLKWPSATGRTYEIDKSDSLETAFTPEQSGIAATPPENTYTVPIVEGTSQQFYQVKLLWP